MPKKICCWFPSQLELEFNGVGLTVYGDGLHLLSNHIRKDPTGAAASRNAVNSLDDQWMKPSQWDEDAG